MHFCCPPGEGCNSPSGTEPCSLSRLRRAHTPEADRALGLWQRYVTVRGPRADSVVRHRRSLRRAYTRVRDRALPQWSPFRPIS